MRVKKDMMFGAGISAGIFTVILAALSFSGTLRFVGGPEDPEPDTVALGVGLEAFVKGNLVPDGVEIGVSEPVESGSLYRSTVTVGGEEHPVYLSSDGKTVFLNPISTEESSVDGSPSAEVPKSARPEVELFIMSYCPYGTQMQKGMLPVLSALGDSIDFTLRFVSYAMHDKQEIDENLRQYCVREQSPDRLVPYLGCFLERGAGTESACLSEAGIKETDIASCMEQADDRFGISRDYADKSTYRGNFPFFAIDAAENEAYGVQGSPTLVINGVTADTPRDPASILATVCGAFEETPAACETELSSETPTSGFGSGSTASAAAGACGG